MRGSDSSVCYTAQESTLEANPGQLAKLISQTLVLLASVPPTGQQKDLTPPFLYTRPTPYITHVQAMGLSHSVFPPQTPSPCPISSPPQMLLVGDHGQSTRAVGKQGTGRPYYQAHRGQPGHLVLG